MKRALLIEWNASTGQRPGNITSKDPGLRCYGWQKLDVFPALEIRMIGDNRDLAQYENLPGVTILEGEAAIDAAIDALDLERYSIDSEELFRMSVTQKSIDLTEFEGMKTYAVLKELHKRKVLGVRKASPKKVSLETV